ncbi:hypothetical protein [Micromonospora sagamiensis]|uniref:hypothetical protein n=1 Tax=Micromonospora sagamiensis TaxID=47875 RepID=UPI00164502D9|nr:hypothetical protein [Micromonospora sagamiensis]
MTTTDPAVPRTVRIHCRIDVVVTDPQAVTDLAVAELRAADIDWSAEEDDPDTAARELRADLPLALAGLLDLPRLVEDLPGVEFRSGRCRAEPVPGGRSTPPAAGEAGPEHR